MPRTTGIFTGKCDPAVIWDEKPVQRSVRLPRTESALWSELLLTSKQAGTTPSSSAVFPVTRSRHRKIGWSAVETSLSKIFGPISTSLTVADFFPWPGWTCTPATSHCLISNHAGASSSMKRRSLQL